MRRGSEESICFPVDRCLLGRPENITRVRKEKKKKKSNQRFLTKEIFTGGKKREKKQLKCNGAQVLTGERTEERGRIKREKRKREGLKEVVVAENN